MSEVEVLLSVDAGRVPPGVLVFYARDPEAPGRRIWAVMAFITLAFTAGSLYGNAGRFPVMILTLTAAAFAILATPSTDDAIPKGSKRPTLVVTPEAVIVRDSAGLRSWRFDDLKEVRPCLHQQCLGMMVVERSGARHFVDNLFFERGEFLREVIGRRLQPRQT